MVDEGVGVNQMTIMDERPSENDNCVPITGFPIGAELRPNNAKLFSRIEQEQRTWGAERAITLPICKVGGQSPPLFTMFNSLVLINSNK